MSSLAVKSIAPFCLMVLNSRSPEDFSLVALMSMNAKGVFMWFISGLVVGCFSTFFLVALCMAGKEYDETMPEVEEKKRSKANLKED